MKTVKQWLEELQEPYRTKALNNLVSMWADYEVESMYDAIQEAFFWSRTDEGFNYWNDLADSKI